MKKILLVTVCALATLSAYGQGTFVANNIGGAAAAGGAADSSWTVDIQTGGATVASGNFAGGGFFLGVSGTAGNPGDTLDFQAVATSPAGDVFTSNVFSGGPLGGGGTPPAPQATIGGAAITAWEGFVIPEPSTYALLALGGAALLLRRRK